MPCMKVNENGFGPLRGVIPPMVTPLSQDRRLDVGGLERLVAHILDGGVHGLFLLGTTGEATDLEYGLRRELVERTCTLVAGRVPVLVGITDTVFDESVKMALFARDCGASGGVAGGANMFPRLFVDLYNAALAKDVDRVRTLQERVMKASSLLYGVGHHNSSFVKGVKCALSLMGICGDTLAEPREPFNAADRERIRASLVELGALR